MTADQFRSVRHFTVAEWQPIEPLSATLVYAVDAWREWLGRPVFIHDAFATDGHVQGSEHAEGLAVDLHVEGLNVWDQWLAAERWSLFQGIGVYPFRRSLLHPEGWEHPGLHLDVRATTIRARWYRDGQGTYHELDGPALARLLT